MASRIDNLVDMLAVLLALRRGQTVACMQPAARALIHKLRCHYLLAGAPYGQSEDAFLVWLDQLWPATKAV